MAYARSHGDREVLHVARGVAIPIAEIEVRASRSSGPGGQHANSSDTRVEVAWDAGEPSSAVNARLRARVIARLGQRVSAVAQDTRSQARNKELALERLRARIEGALHVERPRRPTKPTRASKTRRIETKRRAGQIKRGRRRPTEEG